MIKILRLRNFERRLMQKEKEIEQKAITKENKI